MAMKSIKQKPLMSCQPFIEGQVKPRTRRGTMDRPESTNHTNQGRQAKLNYISTMKRENSTNKQAKMSKQYTFYTLYQYSKTRRLQLLQNHHITRSFACCLFARPEASFHLLTSPFGLGILQLNGFRRIVKLENGCQTLLCFRVLLVIYLNKSTAGLGINIYIY